MEKCAGQIAACSFLEDCIDHCGVRPDFPHCTAVDSEMGQMQRSSEAVGQHITFLFSYKGVDQARNLRVGRRYPGHTAWSKLLLQSLEQQHEIPHRKHVVFHEQPQVRDGRDRLRQRMTVQLHQLRVPAPSNPENHPDAVHPPS